MPSEGHDHDQCLEPRNSRVNGQVIGQTQHAIQAVLDAVLVETETSFHQWVLIRQVALSGGSIARADLVDALTDGLKIETAVAVGVLDEVVGLGLVDALGDAVVLTQTGHDRYERIANAGAQITVRLYGDLPPEDLETTRRVLDDHPRTRQRGTGPRLTPQFATCRLRAGGGACRTRRVGRNRTSARRSATRPARYASQFSCSPTTAR